MLTTVCGGFLARVIDVRVGAWQRELRQNAYQATAFKIFRRIPLGANKKTLTAKGTFGNNISIIAR